MGEQLQRGWVKNVEAGWIAYFHGTTTKGDLMLEMNHGCVEVYVPRYQQLLIHIPDCTGWDWKAPQPIDPGVGYRLIDPNVDQWQRGDEYYVHGSVWYASFNCGEFSESLTYRRKLLPTDWVAITDPEHVLRKDTDQVHYGPGVDWCVVEASAGMKCADHAGALTAYRCQWQHHPDNNPDRLKPTEPRTALMPEYGWRTRNYTPGQSQPVG